MKTRKLNGPECLLICLGLLMATMPALLKDYIQIPDFLRGALGGLGLGLEIGALILIRKRKNAELDCRSNEAG